MRKVLIAVALMVALGVTFNGTTVQSADATSAWNEHAAAYGFSWYPGSLSYSSFESAYFGSDFQADFSGILAAVAHAMGTTIPPWGGGEPFSYVENWPDG